MHGVGGDAADLSAEQSENIVVVRRAGWIFLAAITVGSIATVVLQVTGLIYERGWTHWADIQNERFDAELWAKMSGIVLSGAVGLISSIRAGQEIQAFISKTHRTTYLFQQFVQQVGIEPFKAAMTSLLKQELAAQTDANERNRVEIDKASLESLLKTAELVKELTAAGGVDRMNAMQLDFQRQRERGESELSIQERARTAAEQDAKQRQHQIEALTKENAAMLVACDAANADLKKVEELNTALRTELGRATEVLAQAEPFLTDWASTADKTVKFANAMSRWKSGA